MRRISYVILSLLFASIIGSSVMPASAKPPSFVPPVGGELTSISILNPMMLIAAIAVMVVSSVIVLGYRFTKR